MAAGKIRGILLDVDYIFGEQSTIRLFVKAEKEIKVFFDRGFHPYFFAGVEDEKKAVMEIKGHSFGENIKVKSVGKAKQGLLRVEFNKVEELTAVRKEIKELETVKEIFEYDIPFAKRYLIDRQLQPMNGIELEVEGDEVKGAKVFEEPSPKLNYAAFDIETLSPGRFSNPEKDPVLMISFAKGDNAKLLTTNKKLKGEREVEVFGSEKEMIEGFLKLLEQEKVDVLVTYNGDNFDLPYLKERCKTLGSKAGFYPTGEEPRVKKAGRDNIVKLHGMQHLDAYQMLRFLNRFGVVNLVKFGLESVAFSLFGEEKEKITAEEINEIWESGKGLDRLAKYCMEDSSTALRIATQYSPLVVELCKLVKQTVFETSRASASMLVEYLLLNKAFVENSIVPNKPGEQEINQRFMQSYKGGYVKEPLPGLHERLAVLDFRSLHPSIMISHNVSPETLDCGHKECKENIAPNNHFFCTKQEGFLSGILKELFERRMGIKKKLKGAKGEGKERLLLDARQHALKILMNSAYGYLGYARSRWFSRECAAAVTAWSRKYVQEVLDKADKQGFNALYGDSISRERFVTVLNPKGLIEVKNIECLFNEIPRLAREKNGKEIKPGNGYLVLSVNPKTKKAEWAKLKGIIRHKTSKKMFRVNQKFGETVATEDHSIIVSTSTELKEVSPIEMRSNNFFVVKKIPRVKAIEYIDLFEWLKNYYYERMYKDRVKISQWHKNKTHVWFGFTKQKNQIKIKRFIEIGSTEFKALCRLLGAYAAEGSSTTVETCKDKRGSSIASSDINWLKALERDYNCLFKNAKTSVIPSTKKKRKLRYGKGKTIEYFDKTHKLQMMNETSAVFFKALCGQKSRNKRLPTFIYNVPNKYKKILLEKLVEGDGSHSVNKRLGYSAEYIKKNFSYTTNSLALISGLSLLLRLFGINYSIQYRPEKKSYTIKTSTKSNKRVLTKITQEKYAGFVYDLAVEKNNNFVDACGQVLLHNTDSAFLIMPEGKEKEDVEKFVGEINAALPGVMNLELEGFYKRGIFVTKESGEGAKKKYALIDYENNLKIVGFEYVRRDWSAIAKETQREVIKAILEEGKPEKAVQIVRDTIEKLRSGKALKSELVVLTQLKRSIGKYESIGPHVAAAKKAVKKGKQMEVGSVIGYIVTRSGKSISDKAQLEEYVAEGNYDASYYIEHQVVPAVIKIMRELGYSKEDLIHGGKQAKLGAFG